MQEFVIFVMKYLKGNMLKIKKICQDWDRCHYAGEYRGTAHSLSGFKYSTAKEISITFHNGSYHDYHFYHKRVSRRIWRTIYLFRGKYQKINNHFSSNRKRSSKNWQKLKRNHNNHILQITSYWQPMIYGRFMIKSC